MFCLAGMMMGLGKRAPHSISEGGNIEDLLLFSLIFTSFFCFHLIQLLEYPIPRSRHKKTPMGISWEPREVSYEDPLVSKWPGTNFWKTLFVLYFWVYFFLISHYLMQCCVSHTAWAPKGTKDKVKKAQRAPTKSLDFYELQSNKWRGCAALQEWWWALEKGLRTLFLKEVK